MNDNYLEWLLLGLVELRTSCNLLDELLDNDSVVLVGLGWRHFQVIDRAENDTAAGRRSSRVNLKLFLLSFDLMHRWGVVECLQESLG